MVHHDEILAFADQVARQFHPRRITLFGSFARGDARGDSDVDLLVEMRLRRPGIAVAAEMIRRIQPRFAVDIVVRTPEQVRQRMEWGDFFLREIKATGKVLYETPDA